VVKALKPVTYVRPAVTLDAADIAAYAKVCGFKPEAGVPVLYPQMLTFPLAMEFFASEHCPGPRWARCTWPIASASTTS
jgi:hypothetical protein